MYSSGHGIDGTIQGSFTQGAGGATADGNGATTFGGGYVQFSQGIQLAGGPFTIEAWAQSGGGGIIGGSVWTLSLNGPTVRFRSALSETTYFDFESVRSVNDGAWHHRRNV